MGDAGAASPDAVCPRCDHLNRLAAAYCGGCGADLPGVRPCPACSAPNPRRHRYCEMCGGPMLPPGTSLAPARAALRRPPGRAATQTTAPPGKPLARSLPARLGSAEVYGAIIVAAAAALPRLFRLDSVPEGLSAIEGLFVAAASRVSREGWVGLGPDAVTGEPAGFAYLLGAWSLLAGDSTLALRLFPVALGVATIALFYLLTRRLLDPRPALFAAALLALSLWHLQFSRLILPTMLMLCAVLATANLVTASLDEKRSGVRRKTLAAAAGLAVGLTPYIDSSFPILLAAVAVFCLALASLGHEHAGEVSAALWIAAAAAAVPYLLTAASDPGAAMDHVTGYSITSTQEFRGLQGIPEQTRFLAASVAGMIGRVFFGAFGGEHRMLLDAFTGLLALLGLLVFAVRWQQRGHLLLPAFFVTGVMLAGLTTEHGVYGRLVVAMPAALAAAGYGLHWTLTWMEGRFSRRAIYGSAALLVALISYMNLEAYFGSSPIVP